MNDGFITDPQDSDSDDDGLSDGDEYTQSSDPHDTDSDDDGLTDDVEFTLGTDPNDIDSDNDLLGDYEEVTDIGSDPLDSDTDDDTIDDFEETVPGVDGYVTDPTDADTDGDGYDDDEEITAGTDPTDLNDYPGATTPPSSSPSPTDEGALISSFIGFSLLFIFGLSLVVFVKQRKK